MQAWSNTERKVLTGIIFQLLLYSVVFADINVGKKLFAECYDETINFQREGDNTITSAQVLEGVRLTFPKITTMDIYLKQRYGSDANRDYWNNRTELMLGARARFFSKIYLALFYEYIRGFYVSRKNSAYPNPYGDRYEDVRWGLLFWHGFDNEEEHSWKEHIPLSLWDEIYADAIFYQRDRHNFISYTNIRAGSRLLRVYKTVFDPYFVSYYGIDKNGDFWNNKIDNGFGFRIKPWADLELSLFVEYLYGTFIMRQGDYENPYAKNYYDRRMGILFWYGLGF
ncbi:MAG TPA: hypothetical protein PLP19_18635 [bacterium]|nr:hypothetical protein [bacterium]HPN45516.1 hypothetical protein [bacterium]